MQQTLSIKKPPVQRVSKDLAEVIGIVLGDGSLYVNKKHGVHQFVITGHIVNDRKYISKFVKPMLEKLFRRKFHIKLCKNVIRLYSQEKGVILAFQRCGLLVGNKIKNNVCIPSWIFSSKEFIKACIRGLIDTDGSVYPITGRNYTYISFKSASENLRNSFDRAMSILGYKTSKWSKKGTPEIYIGNKRDLAKYNKEIGFNNPYHKHRFRLLSSSPVSGRQARTKNTRIFTNR